MAKSAAFAAIAILVSLGCSAVLAQSAPSASDKVWHSKAEQSLDRELAAHPETKYAIDATKVYTLAELIDLAQQHNPETRVAWEEWRLSEIDLHGKFQDLERARERQQRALAKMLKLSTGS